MLGNHREVWLVELQENKWSIEKRRMRLRIKRNNPCYEYLSWFYLGNKNHADFFTATQRLLGYTLDGFIFGLTRPRILLSWIAARPGNTCWSNNGLVFWITQFQIVLNEPFYPRPTLVFLYLLPSEPGSITWYWLITEESSIKLINYFLYCLIWGLHSKRRPLIKATWKQVMKAGMEEEEDNTSPPSLLDFVFFFLLDQ